MISEQNVRLHFLPPKVTGADSEHDMAFDRTGFDYCVIDVFKGTGATNTVTFLDIVVSESDTVTVATSMTAIVPLSGAAATSTSYGWAIPAGAATSSARIFTLQFDLKPRKKYIGLALTATNTTGGTCLVGAIARLSRGEISPITAAQRDGVNLTDTNSSGCVVVVSK